jgi:TRAP-type C4-dicarboxylate transport system permease small subunit
VGKLERIIDRVTYAAGYVSGWIVLLIIGLTLTEVITRYVLRQPLILCDEFGGYSLFAVSFLGLSYCARENGHIRITFFVERLPRRLASWLRVGTLCLTFVYVGIVSKVSWDFLLYSYQRNMRSNSWLMTPLMWPQLALPVGFTLLALILILQIHSATKKALSGLKVESGAEGETSL